MKKENEPHYYKGSSIYFIVTLVEKYVKYYNIK